MPEDTSSDEKEGHMGKKKSFTSKLAKKIHNPFKRSNSSSSSSDDENDSSSKAQDARSQSGGHHIRLKFPTKSPHQSKSRSPVKVPDAMATTLSEAQAAVKRSNDPTAPIASHERLHVVTDKGHNVAQAVAKAVSQPPPETKALDAPGASQAKAATIAVTDKTKTAPKAIQEQMAKGSRGAAILPKSEERIKPPSMKGSIPETVPKQDTVVAKGPVYGFAEIAMMGVNGDPNEVMTVLRSRGFIIHLAVAHDEKTPPTMTIAVGLGPKLLIKMAVEKNMPRKEREEYTSGEMAKLCGEAIYVIRRSGLGFDEITILHDKAALKEVSKADRSEAPDAVNDYFGPYIGLYFAWLQYYTRALVIPAVGGIILFLAQWRADTADVKSLPIACILLVVWSALSLELWRRRNSEIAFRWDVSGVEDEALMRVAADKSQEFQPSPAAKYCVTVPIILSAIFLVIRAMLYCIWLSDNATEVYGDDSFMKHYPLFLYSTFPMIASFAYGKLAKILNDFEDHPTAVRRQNMLVVKMFAFQFINSYCSLLYVAFWLRDVKRLRFLLVTLMIVKQFAAQLQEKYMPKFKQYMQDRSRQKNPPSLPRHLVAHTNTITLADLQEELKADPTDMEDDYLEMVLQFGYLSMFAVVFPLAPLFALLNNIWEFQLDLSQLLETRRPEPHPQSTIGAWHLCLEMLVVASCLSNLLLAVLVSEHVPEYVPQTWKDQFGTIEGKVIAAVVVEHLLLAGRAAVTGLVDKAPRIVREAQALIAVRQKEERKEFHRMAEGKQPTQGREEEDDDRAKRGPTNKERLQNMHKEYGVWHFGPRWYLPLTILPFIVSWLDFSPLWVIPIAFVFVSYLQHVKDKAARSLSLGVVTDPQVLQMVTNFLPPWYTDTEVERVTWLNKVVQKLWVSASGATKDLMFSTVQPLLDSYRPAGVNALGFRKVSLGTIPPKVVGVRALETKGDKTVIDVNIRWAGNAEVVLEAGVKPVPLLVTLDKIRFSGRMRVELAPIVPMFPCFGAVVLTFMEKPFLDFSFSLGKLDVMSIGPGDASIGAAVSNTIKNIVDSLMVFPHKLVVPILEEQDLLDLAHPTPTGVVQLTLVGGDKLRAADFRGKSDPYVKIKLGRDQLVTTEIVKSTLNPRWDETFDLLVYEQSVEVLEFAVYDYDSGPGADDFLGSCELPLSVLKPDVESAHNIALSNTTSGSLLLKAMFVPLSSGAKRKQLPNEDVLVTAPGDVITDDLVSVDVYQNESSATAVDNSTRSSSKFGGSDDPSSLAPKTVLNPSDKSLGVLTVMGIEVKGVKPGDRYVSVICGNHKRKTPVEEDKADFAYTDVFHFLVKGAKSAVVEVLLKEKETIGNDKVRGSFKVRVAEVMANDDLLDNEWDLAGEKAQGSIKMRLKWSGRVSEDGSTE